MNRDLYDFALEVYERSLNIEDALDRIGFQSSSFNMTSVSLSAILNSLGVDEVEQMELFEGKNIQCLNYYIPFGGNKLYTDQILNDIQSFVLDRPNSEEHYQWKKENLWKMFEDIFKGNKE